MSWILPKREIARDRDSSPCHPSMVRGREREREREREIARVPPPSSGHARRI